ncbi:hypothetical protein H7097_02820 [Aeromicrobium sp.]|nr:hypothetical protein [Candidatus Saccharibacteria bacterium]
MTRIAAFVGSNAIVVVSDGKAVDYAMRTIDIRARKIFRLSPQCLVLASGQTTNHLASEFEAISTRYSSEHHWGVEYIANDLMNLCNTSATDWLGAGNQTFIIAGYTHISSTFEPKLFALLKQSEGWVLQTSVDNLLFMIAGTEALKTHTQLVHELATIPTDTANLNTYALKVLKESAAIAPATIGGVPSLWNIYPSLRLDTKRFTANDILAL